MESTTYPGTTRKLILPQLEKNLILVKIFFVVYSPEREDPGRTNIKINTIPKVLGGYSNNCKLIGKKFIIKFLRSYFNKNLEIAEFTKIFENVLEQ